MRVFTICNFPISNFPISSLPIGNFPISSFPIGNFLRAIRVSWFRVRAEEGLFPVGKTYPGKKVPWGKSNTYLRACVRAFFLFIFLCKSPLTRLQKPL